MKENTLITSNERGLQKSKIKTVNSICIALFLNSRLLVQVLPESIQFNNILVLVLAIVFLTSLINNSLIINRRSSLFFIAIILTFFISFFFNSIDPNNSLYFMYFLVYGGVGLYLSSKDFIVLKVYKIIILTSILMLPFVIIQDFFSNPDTWMGISYSVLPFFYSSAIYLTNKHGKAWQNLAILIGIFLYAFKIYNFFTRGALLAGVIFAFIYFGILSFKPSITKRILITTSFILGVWITLNLEGFVGAINSFLISHNISIRFIQKTLFLLSNDNFMNGRDKYYTLAIEGIKRSPLIGQGIGSFETNTGLNYVHNIFLQLFYEGGVFFLFPVVMILVYILYKIFFNKRTTRSNKVFLWFLFCIVIFRLFVSSVYWAEPAFWFLIGYGTKKSRGKINLYSKK